MTVEIIAPHVLRAMRQDWMFCGLLFDSAGHVVRCERAVSAGTHAAATAELRADLTRSVVRQRRLPVRLRRWRHLLLALLQTRRPARWGRLALLHRR